MSQNNNTITGPASIIIPCWSQLEFTKQCVRALRRHTRPPWELIVVDNGSTDDTAAYLAGVQDAAGVPVSVIRNAANRGFPAAINQGLQAARGEYLVLLNNDVVVTDAWLEQLVALANFTGVGQNGTGPNHATDEVEYTGEVMILDFQEEVAKGNRALGGVRLAPHCEPERAPSPPLAPPCQGGESDAAAGLDKPSSKHIAPPCEGGDGGGGDASLVGAIPIGVESSLDEVGVPTPPGRPLKELCVPTPPFPQAEAGVSTPPSPPLHKGGKICSAAAHTATIQPRIGLVGPMSNYAAPPQLVEDVPYRDIGEMHGFAGKWRDEHRGQWFTVPKLSGFCLLVRREVYDKIGGLDERFGLGLFDDDDLAERARRAGFELAVAHDLFVHHFGSRTFLGNGVDAETLLDDNARRFAAKWGLNGTHGKRVALRPWQSVGQAFQPDTVFQGALPVHVTPESLTHVEARVGLERPTDGGRPRVSLTMIVRVRHTGYVDRALRLKKLDRDSRLLQGIYGHLTRRNLAMLAAERGDPAEAGTLWNAVLAECPGDRDALARLQRLQTRKPAVPHETSR